MRFLARHAIGAKLLVTPALVSGLLLLVAAAASYGLQARHEALERIYEIRIQRLRATTAGLNDVRSVNEGCTWCWPTIDRRAWRARRCLPPSESTR